MRDLPPVIVLLVGLTLTAAATSSEAGFAATDVVVPSVGRAQGVADWYTTLWVHNPDSSPAVVQFYFLRRDQANIAAVPVSVTVPPGDTVRYADALSELFGVQGFGALRIVSDRSVLVSTRIYAKSAGEGESASKGQDLVGIPTALAIGAGQRTEILGVYQTQPAASSEYRTNYGFVEVTGAGCTIQVVPIDSAGTPLASPKTTTLRGFEPKQYQLSAEFASVSTYNARLQVQVVSGAGRVIAFGSSIANLSQDPTTFEMRFDEALLGGGAVVHDGSLTGNGTGTSPLGVADHSISKAKLQASGGTAGQVLATDGTSLAWQSAGLSLPYSGSAASAGPLVAVTNTSGNAAIQGRSQSAAPSSLRPAVVGTAGDPSTLGQGTTYPTGILGDSHYGNGVTGTSDEGAGVYGASTNTVGVFGVGESDKGVLGVGGVAGVTGATDSGDGVLGQATSGNGIHGESTSGYAGRFDGKVRIAASTPPGSDGFTATNTGGGRGLTVSATTDTALWALSTSGIGIDARSTSGNGLNATSSTGYAGYFFGKVAVTGAITKLGGGFKIDHPLDPERRYLVHSFVESPDMKNVYDGVVVTDDEGRAVVELPEWFQALNRDFRYQLTVIGRFAQAIVEEEIADNRFTIRTNLGGVKVSWQVTGIRRDAWAEANRLPVEEDKPSGEQGTYLAPEAFGLGHERSLESRAVPPAPQPEP